MAWACQTVEWQFTHYFSQVTGSHFIVILFTHKCQLYIWEQSNPFSSIVVFVYKLLRIPCISTSNLYSNVTTSTRINSSSVHTYICVCFIRNSYNTFQFHSAMVCWPIIQQLSSQSFIASGQQMTVQLDCSKMGTQPLPSMKLFPWEWKKCHTWWLNV